MSSAIHIKTRVLPGKKIQIASDDLVEGQAVDVFVITSERPKRPRTNVLELLRSTPAPGVFATPDEVDEYIERERDSWDA
jgi:hypothetical protein